MKDENYTLLRAGPVNISEDVKKSLMNPDIGHRSEEFQELYSSLQDNLSYVFQAPPEKYDFAIITGSGTAAMESVMCSLKHSQILVINTGKFGNRMAKLGKIHDHEVIDYDTDLESIDFNDLDQVLEEHPETDYVAMVHSETSTGRLNPIEDVKELAEKHDSKLIVDTISSLGAEEVNVDEMGIDICISNSNKALEAPPVISFVCIRQPLRDDLVDEPRSFYLDLKRHLKYAEKNQTPTTPAVPLYYAVNQALEEIKEEGLENKLERHNERMKYLNKELEDMPVNIRVEDFEERSNSSIIFSFNDSTTYDELNNFLKDHGIQIYSSIFGDDEAHVTWLGEVDKKEIDRFLELLEEFFEEKSD